MITKPQGWDTATAYTGDSVALPSGGYVCEIKKAAVDTSRSGQEMLILLLDIAEGEYKGYYQKQFDAAKLNNPEAKWGCVFRQLTSSTGFFKGLITCIEASNNDYVWSWDEATLKGKRIGILFGREEYQNQNGEKRWRTTAKMARTVTKICNGEFEVPKDKPLPDTSAINNFGLPPVDDGTLPF